MDAKGSLPEGKGFQDKVGKGSVQSLAELASLMLCMNLKIWRYHIKVFLKRKIFLKKQPQYIKGKIVIHVPNYKYFA